MFYRVEVDVKAFVAMQASFNFEDLSLQTRLSEDLGVDGDDAVEFLEKFSEEFNVDLSSFPYNRHFTSEGLSLLWLLAPENKLVPVTLQDLVDAVKAGKLVKEY